MDKRHVIRNIRSNQVVDGSPKLPTAEQILHGEIAINFAKEHETLSLKNDNDEIVAFELRSVSNLDEKLNEEIERAQTAEQANTQGLTNEINRATNSENEIKETYLKNINVNGIDGAFEENVASITVQGKDIVLTDKYDVIEYPSPFENRASHVNASNTIDSAFHNIESTIKTLSEDVITNELTTANSISSLAEVVGVMTIDNAIVYEPNTNTNYLSEANSVHHATVILDNKIKEIEDETEKIRSIEIKDVKVNGVSSVDSVDKTAYINLSAKNIPLTSAKDETSTIYSELNSIKDDFSNQIEHINQTISGGTESLDGKISRVENSLQNKTNDLTNKIIEDELTTANSINALVEASGLISSNNEITYTKKANPYYIGEASSLSDAINILDENLNIVQQLIETSIKKAITDLINANPSLNMNNPFKMPNT